MPTASAVKPYSPTDPTPYEAYQPPEPLPPAPSPTQDQQPEVPNLGAVKTSGAVAYAVNAGLRGFMQGKAHGEAVKAIRLKKQVDDIQGLYNTAAQNLLQLKQSGVAENSPEWKQAKSNVDGAWSALMSFYGQHLAPPEKKRGKAAQAGHNLLDMFRSQDPAQVSQAWYAIAQKMGPPVYSQIQAAGGPISTSGREYQTGAGEVEATRVKSEKELQDLLLQDTSKLSDEMQKQRAARIKQLQEVMAIGGPASQTATRYSVPRYGPVVNSADLTRMYPDGVPGPNGMFTPEPGAAYRELNYGVENGQPLIRYEPMSVSQQFKNVRGPHGTPVDVNYNPIQGTVDKEHPLAEAPVRGEVKSVPQYDAQGNLIGTELVPVIPPYLPPTPSGAPRQATAPVQPPASVTPPATPPAQVAPPTQTAPPPAPEPGERRKSSRAPLAPQQDQAATDAIARGQSSNLQAPKFFARYDKTAQGKYMAIRGQEQTLNGVPNTPDIGLRQATLTLMDEVEKNPALATQVAVALQAVDQHAKSGLTGKQEGDYSWLKYIGENWNTIPALQAAFAPLQNDPAATNYMDYFFRAWTNAATLRALQGTTGRATQAMYPMLTSELPMVGANVHTKQQAEHKLDLMQQEVRLAEETLPEALQRTLSQDFGRPTGKDSGNKPPVTPDLDKKLDEIFGKPKPKSKSQGEQ